MDIDDLMTRDAHESGAELRIVNPKTGKKTDIYIKLMGVDSRAFRKAQKAAIRKVIAAKGNLNEDEFLDEDIEQLVAITIGWRGAKRNGKEFEFNEANCRELYSQSPAIADQVDRFIGNRANFTKG